jgi:hypothetical protein
MQDQTDAMNQKVTRVVQDWWRKHREMPAGYRSSKPLIIVTKAQNPLNRAEVERHFEGELAKK